MVLLMDVPCLSICPELLADGGSKGTWVNCELTALKVTNSPTSPSPPRESWVSGPEH